MKKRYLFYILPFFAFLLMIPGCGGPSASSTVEEFMNAMNFGDFNRARELASSDSQAAIDWAESMNSLNRSDRYENFEITREEIDGDYGRVYYVLENGTEEQFLKVKKDYEGEWVVMFSKADLGDGNSTYDNDTDLDLNLGGVNNILGEAVDQLGNLDTSSPTADRGMDAEPIQVAEKFLKAIAYGDYERARKLTSPESDAGLDWVKSMNPGGTGEKDFSVNRSEVDEPYATVYYTVDGDNKTKELDMIHSEEGKWMVVTSKKEFQEAQDQMFEELEEGLDEMDAE